VPRGQRRQFGFGNPAARTREVIAVAADHKRRSSVTSRADAPGAGSAAGAGATKLAVLKVVGEVEFSSQYNSPHRRHSIS
jgi:hypothetical protein